MGSAKNHASEVVDAVSRAQRTRECAGDLGLTSVVLDSWVRCLNDHALDPGDRTIEVVLDESELRQRRQRLGDVFEIARSEMENLYQQTAESGYAVLLTDATATIMERIGDPTLDKEFARAGLWPGSKWSEDCAGTNGMGTCVHEQTPVTVHRDEHFLSCNIALSCSASPIFDPKGELLGVLDTSSVCSRDTRQHQHHTVALVNMSARLIENCALLRTFHDGWVLRFHVRPEFVGLLTEGMLAVDDDGCVAGVNQSAVTQLGVESRAELIGQSVNALFDLPESLFSQGGGRSDPSVWPMRELHGGKRYFATLRGPTTASRRGRVHASSKRGAVRPLRPAPMASTYTLRGLMNGGDPRMAYNVRCAERLVDRNVSALLYGETGTGKEAFAQAMHAASQRSDGPFVAVNCASIPESLIESELFGYSSGAFTGARREGMRGKIQQSSGGTLFLDEIGDMPPELQTRLLRVLEQEELLPLGSETPVPVDIHVISATHRDLPSMVAQGVFREDLYYRLNGVALTLPALRHRHDREMIIRSVLGEECPPGEEVTIDAEAFARLMDYSWPGNIRQLRNCIRTTLALCDGSMVQLADLSPEILEGHSHARDAGGGGLAERSTAAPQAERREGVAADEESAPPNPLVSAERETLLHELERNRWNITATAICLSVSRNTVYRKMKAHGIEYTRRREDLDI
jgi:transcriptional regulator of acetoin/glycerol metabolism